MMVKLVQWLRQFLVLLLILLVRFYQVCLGPLLPKVCRYYPSCSEYFVLSVQKYGPVRGTWKGICRICRCHPWSKGGFDPP